MAAAAARAGALAANCAVHIKVSPQTLNLRESREVLRVLKEYGEVVSFRNFALIPPYHHHHTILAVFQNPEAATSFKAASPLQFTIQEARRPSPKTVASPASFAPDPSQLSQGPTSSEKRGSQEDAATNEASETESEQPQPGFRERSFHLTADTSTYPYIDHIRRQYPYWGYPDRQKSFAREDLERPGSGVPVKGMADIDPWTAEMPQRVVDKNTRHVQNRQMRRLGWFRGENINLNRLEKAQERERQEEFERLRSMRRIAAKEKQMAPITEWDELQASANYGRVPDPADDDSHWGQLAQLSNGRSNINADNSGGTGGKWLDHVNEREHSPFPPTPRPQRSRAPEGLSSERNNNNMEDLPPATPIDLNAYRKHEKSTQAESPQSTQATLRHMKNTTDRPSSNHNNNNQITRTDQAQSNAASNASEDTAHIAAESSYPAEQDSSSNPLQRPRHPDPDPARSPHTTERHPQPQRQYRLLRFNQRARAALAYLSHVNTSPGSTSRDASEDANNIPQAQAQEQEKKPSPNMHSAGPWGSLSPRQSEAVEASH